MLPGTLLPSIIQYLHYFIYLFIYLLIYLFIYLHIYLFIYLFTHLSILLFINFCTYSSRDYGPYWPTGGTIQKKVRISNFYAVLNTTLHYTTFNYTIFHYTTLHYTTVHHTTLQYTAPINDATHLSPDDH